MNLSSEQLIWLNGIVILVIIGSYLFTRRKPAEPVRLRMFDGAERDVTGSAADLSNKVSTLTSDDRQRRFEAALRDPDMFCPMPASMEGAVHFNYNGHTWDAFEVLGLRPGAKADEVGRALQRTLSMVEPESRSFVRAAFEAIRRHRSSSGT